MGYLPLSETPSESKTLKSYSQSQKRLQEDVEDAKELIENYVNNISKRFNKYLIILEAKYHLIFSCFYTKDEVGMQLVSDLTDLKSLDPESYLDLSKELNGHKWTPTSGYYKNTEMFLGVVATESEHWFYLIVKVSKK